jgi:hypothetical protein
MKQTLQEFLDRNLPLPGVAAYSVRLADRTYATRCHSDWFTPAQAEQALGRLALAADGLGYHGIQPTRLCWVFDHTRIHLVLRPDGACLACFVENRPGLAHEKLESFLEEFNALPTLAAPAVGPGLQDAAGQTP